MPAAAQKDMVSSVSEYHIIKADNFKSLEKIINTMIEDGYTPLGGPFTNGPRNFFQAVTK